MIPQLHQLLLLSLLFSLYSFSIAASDLYTDTDTCALLALRKAIPGLWNISDDRPCNWTGVTCLRSRVIELRLPAMALSGTIPPQIAHLPSLQILYLQSNSFSGQIPQFLFNLQNLVVLNLANNNFIGAISPDFNKLTRLATLHLEGNHLNGSIPNLNLASLDQFNVSFNKLTGPIPESLSIMPASSFIGNSLCGKPLFVCNGGSNINKFYGGGILGIVIGCFVGCLCRKRRTQFRRQVGATENALNAVTLEVTEGDADSSEAKDFEFDLDELLRASAEVLGKGAFGTTYKATLEVGETLAVHRLRDVNVSEKEFEDMVGAIEKMKHENLLPLKAYYYSPEEKLLVYEYMPMGSLSAFLHGNTVGGGKTPINWETRTRIAIEAATAIAQIHSLDPSMSHGNIKSSNIFLTPTSEVRVSEFGLANMAGPNRIEGGYRAPEVTDAKIVSHKGDVYSFGVLLLELLTGKDPNESHLKDEGMDLAKWMLSAVKNEWTSEVFDLELLRYENIEEVMLQFLDLSFSCTTQDPIDRPSMAEVLNQIEYLSGSASHVHVDLATNRSVLGQHFKGQRAWKLYSKEKKSVRKGSTSHGDNSGEGLVYIGNAPTVFDLDDLLSSTAEVIGNGTCGTTYKVIVQLGMTMAVKRMKDVIVAENEFREIIEALGKIIHENLISRRAYYYSKDEKLLVYEYMPTGSLSSVLHGNRGAVKIPLNLDARIGIALGVARAIAHLHSIGPTFCHGKIKSSNILLTRTFEARVSDFGLAKITKPTLIDGYGAPEVSDTSQVSQKADVYSFGVLLMELLTGKDPKELHLKGEGFDLPRWVRSSVNDNRSSEVFEVELLMQNVEEDMFQLLEIALSCSVEDANNRPSMADVNNLIEMLRLSRSRST